MMRACLGYPGFRCGRLVRGASRCGDCQRAAWRHWNANRDPFARKVYASAAWRRLADAVVAAASGCAYCGRADVKLTADHIIGIRRDPSRALDPSNLLAACRSCQERRKHNPAWVGGIVATEVGMLAPIQSLAVLDGPCCEAADAVIGAAEGGCSCCSSVPEMAK